MDSIVPMVYGNLALDLIMKGKSGLLVNMKKGTFGNAPLDIVTSYKKLVDVEKWYDTKRLRPKYHNFESNGVFALASE
jgi:6-phosphofructokinase 1